MKELGAQCLVEATVYILQNPQFIVNGFIRAGIPKAQSVDFDSDQEIGIYDNHSVLDDSEFDEEIDIID